MTKQRRFLRLRRFFKGFTFTWWAYKECWLPYIKDKEATVSDTDWFFNTLSYR